MLFRIPLFLCSFLLIMFTCLNAQTINTITVMPDSSIVTNGVDIKKGVAIQKDTVKNIDALNGANFTISVSMTNLDRYIKITEFSKNIEFIKFTRDRNSAIITFKAKSFGQANLNFQIDDEKNVIGKYIYKINITNAVAQKSQTPTKQEVGKQTVPQTLLTTTASGSKQTTYKAENLKPETQKSEIVSPKTIQEETKVITQNTVVPIEEQRLFNLAEDLRISADYSNAINTYKDMITKYPKSSLVIEARFKIAEVYVNDKDYSKALNEYSLLSKDTNTSDDNKSLAIYLSGLTSKQENKQKEAVYYFLESINMYPETYASLNASYEYADSMKKQGALSDGYAILNQAIESEKYFDKRSDALILLAEIYEKGNAYIRDYQKSYNTYSKYLAEYPSGDYARYAYERMSFINRNFINIK